MHNAHMCTHTHTQDLPLILLTLAPGLPVEMLPLARTPEPTHVTLMMLLAPNRLQSLQAGVAVQGLRIWVWVPVLVLVLVLVLTLVPVLVLVLVLDLVLVLVLVLALV